MAVAESTVPGRARPAGERPSGERPSGERAGTHFAPQAGHSPRSDGEGQARFPGTLRALGGWPAVAALSLVATVLTWRWQAWKPVLAGLSSWQAGVTLAFLHHLQWGPQMMFTFGPYGFLEDALPYARVTAALGLGFGLALRWGLAAMVLTALRRSWGLWPAGVAAWLAVGLAANLVEASQLGTVVALGLALASFEAVGRRRLVLLGLLGALAGLEALVEISAGGLCTVLAALAVAGPRGTTRARARGLGAAGVPFVAVPVVALLAGGQDLGNLPSYLRGSLSVVMGYTPAMSISTGRGAEDWFALVDLALLGTAFALSLRPKPRRERLAISLALVVWAWELGKEGFVRHDLHDLTFFSLLVAAMCLARLPRRWAPAQAGAVAVAAALTCVANAGVPLALISPAESARALAGAAGDLVSGARWAQVQRAVEAQQRRTGDGLPTSLYLALVGHSFAVEPLEDSMTSAYPALRQWDPEPVLQAYNAYTPYLDHLDAAFLASARAPELVLYRPVSTERQDPAWEPPAATEALYCRYGEVSTADHWVLLRRVPDRCGHPQPVGTATGHFGEPIPVPRVPGKMVVARLSVGLPLTTLIENTLLKGPAVHLTAWEGATGTGLSEVTYRFVASTAGDNHVMSAPAALGYTPGYGPAPVRRFELTGGGWAAGQGTVRARFYAVSLARAYAVSLARATP